MVNCFVLHADSAFGQTLIESLLAHGNTVTAFCYHPTKIRIFPHPKLRLKIFDEWDTHAVESVCQDNQMFFWNLEAPLRARIDFDLRFLPTTMQCLKHHSKRFLFFSERPPFAENTQQNQKQLGPKNSDLTLQESIEEELLRSSVLGIDTYVIHTNRFVSRAVVESLVQEILKPNLALRRITLSSKSLEAAQDSFRTNGL